MQTFNNTLLANDKSRIEEVKSYINANLNVDLHESVLARKFGYSRSTLKRHFYSCFSESIHHYILRYRMETAKKMLIEHVGTVAEVGELVGYYNGSAFTRSFKQFFGFSPIHLFRKQISF